MSLLPPANEKQNCEEEGGAISAPIAPPTSVSEHTSQCQMHAPLPDVPPPPPPLPGLGQQRRRVRSFYWKPIPEERVHQRREPNLWTLGWVAGKHTFHIDVKTIEELFGQRDYTQSQTTSSSKGSQSPGLVQEPRKEITILDSKRSMNVAIFLKRFKKSNQSIVEDLLHGNSDVFGPEPLRELLKLLPESEEVEKLQAYSGDLSQLTTADSFMYHLTALPRFSLRIEALLLKEELSPLCSSLKKDITTVRSATRELLSCTELHSILHLVLQAGNIMNTGGYGGVAVGFKLSSLLSLADTKANKPGMNLLHFVALEAQKNDEELLRFPEKLPHIENAARVSVESLDEELDTLRLRISSTQEKIQTDLELLQQLQTFMQAAAGAIAEVSSSRAELQKEGEDMIDFFCEDKETFKLDECFHIFHNFCSKFRKAVQDNVEREMRAESRLKRLRDLEVKRSSWAGLDKLGGAFGSRCSSETDVQAALKREGLWGFLRAHSLSPQSPLGQFGSLRRSRQQFSDSITESVITVDTHSLVPPLQAFSFDPLTEPHNGNTPTQIQDPWGPGQADLIVTESKLHPNPENGVHSEKTIATTGESETNISPDWSEKPNEEENASAAHVDFQHSAYSAASLSVQSAIKTTRDSTEFTSEVSEVKLAHWSVSVSSTEAPGSDFNPSTNRQMRKDIQRQSVNPEDKRALIRRMSTSRSATPPEPPKFSQINPSRPLHPVRTLTPSENQSMRKVVPINRHLQTSAVPSTSHPPTSKRSSMQRSPVQRSSTQRSPVRKVMVQPKSPPEEKMCRSTLSTLAGESGALSLYQNPSHIHSPHFAQGTVASATRRAAVAPGNHPVNESTVATTSKAPSLNRATSLRLAQSRVTSPSRVTLQSGVTSHSGVTSPSRVTSQSGVTSHSGVTSPSRVTSQSGVTSQSKVTSPSRVTSQSGVTSQSKVTSPSRVTSQSGVTSQSKVTSPSRVTSQSGVTSQSKVTSLSRVSSQSGVIAQSRGISKSAATRTQNVQLTPSVGHKRKDISSEKLSVFRESQKKPLRPAWR
ncbi:uncharacterized protein [Salminus brasiliensis]|uniref:uncharacterized protein n=1 Tax=Salminus brasiliensis TaxID=930266 RepID=UPI003B83241C